MEQLTALAQNGIEMHTQIVLCPEVNDGHELERSLLDLAGLWPQVKSVAIVPVGLTGYRNNLFKLRKFTPAEAGSLIDIIHMMQKEFIRKYGTPLVYLADEFYVMAQKAFPSDDLYGEYPQLENGVGLVRLFYDSFAEMQSLLPDLMEKNVRIGLVTGSSGAYVLSPVVERLNQIKNLHVELVAVENDFFGGHVSVAGLLTGQDIIKCLQKKDSFNLILLPSVMCKRDEPVFLDGKAPKDIEQALGVPVEVVNLNDGAKHLIKAIVSADKGGVCCG
jgi:putative radical SAM enzyme (TIGR03279 family)